MAQLIWSPRSIRDLQDVCDYISRSSDRYARVFARQVIVLAESIPHQPLLGAIVPEENQFELRERLFHNYRIIYRLRGDDVEIVSICHGARLLPPDL